MRLRALLPGIALVAGIAAAQEHGKTDVFAARGARLAWAIERGPDEARTFVVIRVAVDTSLHGHLSVTGRDPFTNEKREWTAVSLSPGRADVRIPRAGFADFPRTEFRFYPGVASTVPSLEVFYHGVPDTTPEFDDRGRLEKYLDERLRSASVIR